MGNIGRAKVSKGEARQNHADREATLQEGFVYNRFHVLFVT
jgi:hypothetical protein